MFLLYSWHFRGWRWGEEWNFNTHGFPNDDKNDQKDPDPKQFNHSSTQCQEILWHVYITRGDKWRSSHHSGTAIRSIFHERTFHKATLSILLGLSKQMMSIYSYNFVNKLGKHFVTFICHFPPNSSFVLHSSTFWASLSVYYFIHS